MGGQRGFSKVTSPTCERHIADVLQPLWIKIFVLVTKRPPLLTGYQIDLGFCVHFYLARGESLAVSDASSNALQHRDALVSVQTKRFLEKVSYSSQWG